MHFTSHLKSTKSMMLDQRDEIENAARCFKCSEKEPSVYKGNIQPTVQRTSVKPTSCICQTTCKMPPNLYLFLSNKRIPFEPSEQCLIEYQHSATLHASPHRSGTHSTE